MEKLKSDNVDGKVCATALKVIKAVVIAILQHIIDKRYAISYRQKIRIMLVKETPQSTMIYMFVRAGCIFKKYIMMI